MGRALRHPEIELQPFHEETLVLVAAPAHRFARARRVTMADVGTEQVIMFDRTSSYYEITQAAFLAAAATVRSMMELDNIEAAKKMVERGLGVALLPRTAVVREVAAGALCLVPVADSSPMRRTIVAMRRRDAGPAAGITAAFLGLLEQFRPDAGTGPYDGGGERPEPDAAAIDRIV